MGPKLWDRNKIFRDIAWGLASKGIAALRYDKRTLQHASEFTPEQLAQLTVQEEVIDDALLAAELMRQTPEIDPKRVYLLGHSLGASVAPRIGQEDPNLAGLVIYGRHYPSLGECHRGTVPYHNGLSG